MIWSAKPPTEWAMYILVSPYWSFVVLPSCTSYCRASAGDRLACVLNLNRASQQLNTSSSLLGSLSLSITRCLSWGCLQGNVILQQPLKLRMGYRFPESGLAAHRTKSFVCFLKCTVPFVNDEYSDWSCRSKRGVFSKFACPLQVLNSFVII